MKKLAVILMLCTLGCIIIGWYNLFHYLNTPGGKGAAVLVTIKPGTSLLTTTEILAHKGVLKRPRWLYYYARARRLTAIKAGEYELSPSMAPKVILQKLISGAVVQTRITIPEGLNVYEVATLLQKRHITEKAAFLQACRQKALLQRHNISATGCEGYLFPSTYQFARQSAPERVVETMLSQFATHFSPEIVNAGAHLGLSPPDIVTLASIIEKETAERDEMPKISRVFHNRLTQGMPLQADPTVIYAELLATGSFDGDISRTDLSRAHPYNTYHQSGLPPGPIANPGLAALKAAVNPSTGDDLYFVATGNGGHLFCPDYECHKRAVQKLQAGSGRPLRRTRQ